MATGQTNTGGQHQRPKRANIALHPPTTGRRPGPKGHRVAGPRPATHPSPSTAHPKLPHSARRGPGH